MIRIWMPSSNGFAKGRLHIQESSGHDAPALEGALRAIIRLVVSKSLENTLRDADLTPEQFEK